MPLSELDKVQSYIKRDFNSIREDLISLLKVYYPDQFQDFNAASVGMSLVELLAYVSDLLSYQTDKKFNEQFIDGLTDLASAYRLAKTFGFRPPGVRPSITVADFNVDVPPTAIGPDSTYLPIYRAGMQLRGNGKIFETVNDCDFSSDFSEEGAANRKIEPILNANQDIIKYRITKREKIKAGQTKIYKKEISSTEAATPFFEVILPENNILEIVSVIVKTSVNIASPPTYSDFTDSTIRYYEVEELADSKVFLVDDTIADVNGVKTGRYVTVNKRFVKEFMSDGKCKLTFGGGTTDFDAYDYYLSQLSIGQEDLVEIKDIFNNSALGTKLPANSTLYVKYRAGGGSNSNVGSGVLNQISNINPVIAGADPVKNQSVISSTQATNVLPAIGGVDLPSVDEIKYMIGSNFASQKRSITLSDYISRCYQIPGKFGAPFRVHGEVQDNKIKLYILSKDSDGKLTTNSTETMKSNLIEYLSAYRSVNDFVEINDGNVINLMIETDLFIDRNYNYNEVKLEAINVIKLHFDINKKQMNENIYVSQLVDELKNIAGIINVVDVRFYNLEGGNYSSTLLSQANGDTESVVPGTFRHKIELVNNAIYGTAISMFELRYPEIDIRVRNI